MKKVSVIIPVYNCEEYLAECFDSIVNQTMDLKDIEVIIINDGSKDNSLTIIKEYIDKYQDWILIDRPNKGLSISRNEGMERATSEYITFLDSDDYLASDALNQLYIMAKETEADIVVARLNGFDSKGEYGYYSDKYIYDYKTFNIKENISFIKTISVCSKLYKREFISSFRFIPSIKHEDNYFTINCYLQASRITTVPKYYYYRRYRENEKQSIMQNLSIDSFKDLVRNYVVFFEQNKMEPYILKFSIKYFNNYVISRIKKEEKKQAKKIIKEYIHDFYINRRFNFCKYSYLIIYSKVYSILGELYYHARKVLKNEK